MGKEEIVRHPVIFVAAAPAIFVLAVSNGDTGVRKPLSSQRKPSREML
jgi:hypothetical protein